MNQIKSLSQLSYLWNTDQFYVIQKPNFYKATFAIHSSPNHLWHRINSEVFVSRKPTEDEAKRELKKFVDKQILRKLSQLKVGKNQIGLSASLGSEVDRTKGIHIWLEYDMANPYKKNYVVFNQGKKILLGRIRKK